MKLEIPDDCFDDEALENTPARWERFMGEWLKQSEDFKFTVFPNKQKYNQMVAVTDIDFFSLCEHHTVPFFGKAHVAYIPDKSYVGLSKIPRLVDFHANRPQVQEKLTEAICDNIEQKLKPLGTMVVLEARHLCMEMRGIRKVGARTLTSAIRGKFIEHPDTKAEFLSLIRRVDF